MAVTKRKKKKIRYKKFEFKLSDKQRNIIERFCLLKKTSPNKMIKAAIREYIGKYADSFPEDEFLGENQLRLFDFDEESAELESAAESTTEYNGKLF